MVNNRVSILVIVFSTIGLTAVAMGFFLLLRSRSVEDTTNSRVNKDECNINPNCSLNEICANNKPSESGILRNFLLVNQGKSTYKIPFLNPELTEVVYNSSSNHFFGSMTFDCVTGTVYSIHAEKGACTGKYNITRMSYDGSNHELFIQDAGCLEDISIDWISRNIFWTELKAGQIIVASLRTKKQIILAEKDLHSPRGIVVHPGRGKIFWADAGIDNPKVEVANEDGSEREIFWNSTNLIPLALAIDWISDKLCWSDSIYNTISCAPIDSGPVDKIVLKSLSFNIAISADRFYWTHYRTNVVHQKNRKTGVHITIHLSGKTEPCGLVLVEEECPKVSNGCRNAHGGCNGTQLCLPIGRSEKRCM